MRVLVYDTRAHVFLLGPLAGQITLLSLRTNKADTM